MRTFEHPRDLVRFGDYELDPATGELTNAGSTIRLQPQPLKVLLALIRSPGELVTREQLKQEVMPDTPYGDVDHAINLAVAKLRVALKDSSDEPEFIDTLPRRGYRFVAAVRLPSALKGNQTVQRHRHGTSTLHDSDRVAGDVYRVGRDHQWPASRGRRQKAHYRDRHIHEQHGRCGIRFDVQAGSLRSYSALTLLHSPFGRAHL